MAAVIFGEIFHGIAAVIFRTGCFVTIMTSAAISGIMMTSVQKWFVFRADEFITAILPFMERPARRYPFAFVIRPIHADFWIR